MRADIAHATRNALRRAGGKPVAPENYHVTLKFLGSVNAAGREALYAAADGLRAPRFDFALDRIGHWPRPRILWLGAGTVPVSLAALVRHIDTAAQACGIDPEIRPYRPHVSLARKVRGPVDGGSVEPVYWRAEAFVLAESETAPAGARYRVLRSWPLDPKL